MPDEEESFTRSYSHAGGQTFKKLSSEDELVGVEYRHVPSFGDEAAGFRATHAPEDDESSAGSVRLEYVPGEIEEDDDPDPAFYFGKPPTIDGLIRYLDQYKELLA